MQIRSLITGSQSTDWHVWN